MSDTENRNNASSEESGFLSKKTKTILITVFAVILLLIIIVVILVRTGVLTFSEKSELSDSSRSNNGPGKAKVRDSSKSSGSKKNELSGESGSNEPKNDEDAKLYG